MSYITILLMAASLTQTSVGPPRLSSRPDAKISLYLDFDGHHQQQWGKYTGFLGRGVTTVPFALDTERRTHEAIIEIWDRVSEDYSPFNVNVTTVEPADPNQTAHIVIGGHTRAWYGYRGQDGRAYGYEASGVSMQDGFIDHSNHVGFVFSDNLQSFGTKWVKAIAESASHEAGHMFGCWHLPARDKNGYVTAAYNTGNRNWGPIMGIGFYTDRSLWHKATNSQGVMQDDVQSLTNALGQAPDDFPDEPIHALPIVNNPIDINGIIEHSSDTDLFHFKSNGGLVRLSLGSKCAGPNLKAVLELTHAKGEVYGKIESGQSMEVEVQPGTCYISIKPLKGYGNLGRYWVNGELPQTAIPWTLLGAQ